MGHHIYMAFHCPCYKRQAVQDNETTRGSGVDKLQERFENTTTNEEYNNVDYDFVAKQMTLYEKLK